MLQLEVTENYIQELERQYDLTNDQLRPVNHVTMEYALKILSKDLYLAEIGEKLVKLSI